MKTRYSFYEFYIFYKDRYKSAETGVFLLNSAGQTFFVTQESPMTLKGTVQRDVRPPSFFFIRPCLFHWPMDWKYFRFWLRFRRVIWIFVKISPQYDNALSQSHPQDDTALSQSPRSMILRRVSQNQHPFLKTFAQSLRGQCHKKIIEKMKVEKILKKGINFHFC